MINHTAVTNEIELYVMGRKAKAYFERVFIEQK